MLRRQVPSVEQLCRRNLPPLPAARRRAARRDRPLQPAAGRVLRERGSAELYLANGQARRGLLRAAARRLAALAAVAGGRGGQPLLGRRRGDGDAGAGRAGRAGRGSVPLLRVAASAHGRRGRGEQRDGAAAPRPGCAPRQVEARAARCSAADCGRPPGLWAEHVCPAGFRHRRRGRRAGSAAAQVRVRDRAGLRRAAPFRLAPPLRRTALGGRAPGTGASPQHGLPVVGPVASSPVGGRARGRHRRGAGQRECAERARRLHAAAGHRRARAGEEVARGGAGAARRAAAARGRGGRLGPPDRVPPPVVRPRGGLCRRQRPQPGGVGRELHARLAPRRRLARHRVWRRRRRPPDNRAAACAAHDPGLGLPHQGARGDAAAPVRRPVRARGEAPARGAGREAAQAAAKPRRHLRLAVRAARRPHPHPAPPVLSLRLARLPRLRVRQRAADRPARAARHLRRLLHAVRPLLHAERDQPPLDGQAAARDPLRPRAGLQSRRLDNADAHGAPDPRPRLEEGGPVRRAHTAKPALAAVSGSAGGVGRRRGAARLGAGADAGLAGRGVAARRAATRARRGARRLHLRPVRARQRARVHRPGRPRGGGGGGGPKGRRRRLRLPLRGVV
mmetsp:Transcript_45928/g.143709  ORF Transcript_45928/g.143709 Transcript_45928/m.143709 type:complete len:620 (-) Transcript_45928:174-2033(-)